MHFPRMPIEEESPEQLGYDKIKFNLTESSVRDRTLADLKLDLGKIVLAYTDHAGHPPLRALIAARAGDWRAGWPPTCRSTCRTC